MEIQLTQNKVSLIDDEDFKRVSAYKWYYGNNGYAARNAFENGVRITEYLHRFIMQVRATTVVVDHINDDKLDNRKENLLICTQQLNGMQGNHIRGKIPYRGVSLITRLIGRKSNTKKYRAAIKLPGNKYYCIGYFSTPEHAALAYNKTALEYYGPTFRGFNALPEWDTYASLI